MPARRSNENHTVTATAYIVALLVCGVILVPLYLAYVLPYPEEWTRYWDERQ